MQLIDVEPKTELVRKALEDGIETLEQYEAYVFGYTRAYNDCREQVIRNIKE